MYNNNLVKFCRTISGVKLSVTKNVDELRMKDELFDKTSFLDILTPPIGLRYYCVFNNILEIPKCKNCEKHVSYNRANIQKGFNFYCSNACRDSEKVNFKVETLLSNKEWLYEQRIVLKKAKHVIAKEIGCSITPINKWLKMHNIANVKYNESNNIALLHLKDRDWLYKKHKNEKKKCEDIAKELSISKATVSVWLKKHDILANDSNEYDRKINKITKPTQEIVDFISSFYTGNIEINKRGLIENLELDIFLPDKKIAIEFNGVYSHLHRPEEKTFSAIKGPTYHVKKTNLCEQMGIELIQIFSDSWNAKKDIWKSIIKNKLGLMEEKIYARNCEIVDLDTTSKNNFLDENHLYGKDKSKYKYGLFHKNNLVCLMTFAHARFNKKYDFELVRFCVKKDLIVVGGFSKLLKHFRKNNIGSIISYADRRYSSGKVYENNGFSLLKINRPNYWYVYRGTETLVHRMMMQKYGKNELEKSRNMNFDRIYDCGTKTYILL